MKVFQPFIFAVITLNILLTGCCKTEYGVYRDLSKCHKNTSWDSLKLTNALLGEWKWEHLQCYVCSPDPCPVDTSITLAIMPDSVLEVRQKGQLIQSATWHVVVRDSVSAYLSTTPMIDYVLGSVYLCNDEVEFSASPADLCDHFFKRVK